jgi:modulator of FtsH protease HflC
MSLKSLSLLTLILLAVAARMSLFTVDRTEFVYVTQFGRHVATYDGAKDDEAGLHVRWPWPVQSLTRIDRRLQVLDLPAAELVTEDPTRGGTIDKTVTIDAYILWRIPDAEAAERYVLAIGTTDRAREILRDRIRGRLNAAVASMRFDDLVNTSAGVVDRNRETLREKLRGSATAPDDGLELVDVRVRRLNYPPQVRSAIHDRIISERSTKAAENRARGLTAAEKIRSESEKNISIALSNAKAENDEKRGKADAAADRILNEAISKDPDYYAELQKRVIGDLAMEDRRKVKVWSTQLFRLFFPLTPDRVKGGEK